MSKFLELLSGEGFAYGYRKLTVSLKKQYNLVINKKKVYRLCKQMDVLRPQRQLKIKHPRRLANNRVITGSNQLWATDIKYGWIAGEQRFFFLMSILDVFDRSIIAYHIGLTCEAKHLVQIVQEALMKRQLFDKEKKPVIRSDRDPQFISYLFEETSSRYGIEHERIHPKHQTRMHISKPFIRSWSKNAMNGMNSKVIQKRIRSSRILSVITTNNEFMAVSTIYRHTNTSLQ
jgi:putative transposase